MTKKEKQLAAIEEVRTFLNDPKNRVKNWHHIYEDKEGNNLSTFNDKLALEKACRFCILGAISKFDSYSLLQNLLVPLDSKVFRMKHTKKTLNAFFDKLEGTILSDGRGE